MSEHASPRLIKKYQNRRLYDTKASAYITLAQVKALILEQEDICVVDAKTNDDITRSILLQIILEEESTGGEPLFNSDMLQSLIRFYGHAMQAPMGQYLEQQIGYIREFQNQLAKQGVNAYRPENVEQVWASMQGMQPPFMKDMMESNLRQSQAFMKQMQSFWTAPFKRRDDDE
ncbi:polyhydroxyalkanoate synthesis repressor PhaR [Larsenimonas salina]|uniref:polyhydroxyalkanoate synthesis repressor PhaR n=1 Tax=Larsenimonas salina TaxID=1295565 RepID=UPI002073EFD0|nr:polyhydroxyalkanoate synthesis repressor PhaR [Larsenimonas salina]MCM5703174.1 polyhydroxyalkanoate synthesis repressor PhaR [Larsenimonas salina]